MDELEERVVRSAHKHRALSKERTAWHGTAFMLEAVVLLAFIAFSLAVVCGLFATAHGLQQQTDLRTHAMALATGSPTAGAEAFSADPVAAGERDCAYYAFDGSEAIELDGAAERIYVVERTVTSESTGSGTLYHATVTVSWDGDEVYSLDVDSYVSERGDA